MMENVYEFHDSNAIEEEAATWLIKFDSDITPTPEDRIAFREWVERSPDHRKALQRFSKHWHEDSVLAELAIPLTQSYGHSVKQFFSGLFGSPWSFSAASAMAGVLAVGLYMVFSTGIFKNAGGLGNGTYTTAIGEQQTNTLADGSVLQLNTDTRVQTSFGDDIRKIQLFRGEAYFDVVADPDRPFEVHVGDRIVRAVGTAFSVYLASSNMKVTVTEGKVDLAMVKSRPLSGQGENIDHAVIQKTKPARLGSLKAGQSAVVSSVIDEIKDLDASELSKQLSWRAGLLTFSGDPLSDVVKEINRYTPMTIEITDPALRDIEIGARFRIDDIESIFDVLEVNFGIQVSRLDDLHVQLQSPENRR